MQDAFAHCGALLRAADKERFLTTLFAPAEHRDALIALYAFNVEIARVREVVREALAGLVRYCSCRAPVAAATGLKIGRKALCCEARFGVRFEKSSCSINASERTSEPPH